jgi:hypothetical protein
MEGLAGIFGSQMGTRNIHICYAVWRWRVRVDNLPNGANPSWPRQQPSAPTFWPYPFLHRLMVIRLLTVNGLQLLVERTDDDKKIWKFGEAARRRMRTHSLTNPIATHTSSNKFDSDRTPLSRLREFCSA